MLFRILALLACAGCCSVVPVARAAAAPEKPRLIVLTDIGGDPDDQQSMIRLMAFSNEFEIEGLIASASGTPGELKRAAVRPDLIREIVEAYGKVRANLAAHDPTYPPVERLLAVIKSGDPDRRLQSVGEGRDTEGSRWIISAADRNDRRPLNIVIWGGAHDLAQALWRVRKERSPEDLLRFVSNLRVHSIEHQDETGPWIVNGFPELFFILSSSNAGVSLENPLPREKRLSVYRGMYLGGDMSLTSRAWIDANVRTNPLGALYPLKTWTAPNPNGVLKEGDTPSWFYFLPNGLSDAGRPEWGGWGGRFRRVRDRFYADAEDNAPAGEGARSTVWRWRPDFQNAFTARMTWCSTPDRKKANHEPVAVLNSDRTRRVLSLHAKAGERVRLSAQGSSDPDGDSLTYRWFHYPEPGGSTSAVAIDGAASADASLVVPQGARELHVILEVRDAGSPPLVAYRRAVIRADSTAVQWQRWENLFVAQRQHADPYRDVLLTVTFRGPSGRVIDAPAFWAGGPTFKVRMAFPEAGEWRWQSFCSETGDAGLHNLAGTVRVSAASGDNPLYRHGFLKVSGNRRYLAHADGTPFLWMGDTAWYAIAKSTTEEWRDLVNDRAKKRFSVIQVAALREKEGGPRPFDSQGRPVEEYWQGLDERVEYANQRGVVILMIGFVRPNDPANLKFALSPEFARYAVGRFFAQHLAFSPNFDQMYDPVYDEMAGYMRACTSLHLLTQHPGTRQGQNEIYVPKPYLDFTGLQSGHHNGKLENTYGAAREWPLNLWRLTPTRPVLNIEAMYDGRGKNEGEGWRERDARKLGWISWLSGALGYTYGAGETGRKVAQSNGGIWSFNQNPDDWDYWRRAAAWPSSNQMTLLREFFAALEWWRLEPAHELIRSAATSNLERPVMAAAADRSFAVAYLPVPAPVTIDLSGFPAGMRAEWFDPVTGRRTPASLKEQGKQQYIPPAGGEDWVLVFRR